MCIGPDRPASAPDARRGSARLQRGVTLIELIVVIVIVATALMALFSVLRYTVGHSADPVVQRQTLAIAESLLDEVLSQPFTLLDLNGGADAMGPETGETRYSSTLPFNHVDDYAGFSMSGIVAPDGSAVAGLSSYSASVAEQWQAVASIPSAEGLLVTVTATGPGGFTVSLSGYRARYAP
jgi:MSHA pilin protein MshD